MNCKKYRACLIALIAAAFVCGICIYVKAGSRNEDPAEGILVEHMENKRNSGDVNA